MKVLLIDIDTLRADHLGCYGYKRNTSPNIDEIAEEGVKFNKYYCPNAPCLPSRASFVSGKFGIHTGVVGHDGTGADMWLEGSKRGFRSHMAQNSLFNLFRKAGLYTASVSTFPERHSAWWFNAGFNECVNVGGGGMESAEEVTPEVLSWLDRKGADENWFLHVHYWDPHTPYRAPLELGNPFENEELPDNWINEEIFDEHKRHIGPHGPNEIYMWDDNFDPKYPRHPGKLNSLDDVKKFIDNYDLGVKYADMQVGIIIDKLKKLGVYEDVSVIVTSDHGENLGELGIYGEHATADEPTCRIPMIIKWQGGMKGISDESFHTNVDLAPTVEELLSIKEKYDKWDGESYARTVLNGDTCQRDMVVLTQCAHVCQRSVRFDDYLYIRTYHGGFHMFEDEMLFNIKEDKFQTKNLAKDCPDLCGQGARYLEKWVSDMMQSSDYVTDPLWMVMKEGGPAHARGWKKNYTDRLRSQNRVSDAEVLEKKYKNFN